MFEVIDVLNALGNPLKLAWVGWLAWGVGQYFWFRKRRSMPAKKVTAVAKPAPKKAAAVPKTVAAQAAEAPVVGRLITPSHVMADPKPSAPVAPPVQPVPVAEPAPMPMVAATVEAGQAPAVDSSKAVTFDPSNAVIEQFSAMSDDVLDKFVRDFEMQDARPRRRKTTPVPETPSYGAEAPQIP